MNVQTYIHHHTYSGVPGVPRGPPGMNLIEDALRGRTTARPPLVNGLGLNRRFLEADFGSGLGGLRHTLEALVGILEAF